MTPPFCNKILISLLGIIWLAGCSMTPEYQRPDVATPGWKSTDNTKEAVNPEWWRNYASQELNTLIEQALAHNNDVRASIHRIEHARADLKSAGASLLPSAKAAAAGSARSQLDGEDNGLGFVTTPDMSFATRDWIASAGISYEVDLFGRNRARVAAAKAGALEETYAHGALELVVTGDVAQGYFQVLNLRERRRIAAENLEIASRFLKTLNARFASGARTELDLAEQESVIEERKAELAGIERELAMAQNALAVLTGSAPQIFDVDGHGLDEITLPPMAVEQPSSLLERRPDIKRAEAALMEAGANIGAARAAFFPTFNIGAGMAAAGPVAAPSATIASLAAAVSAPIFEGGRLEGNLERARAKRAELLENYRKAVLIAFRESEDAFAKVDAAAKRERSLKRSAGKASKAYELAQRQYSLSIVNFQRVLRAQERLLDARDLYARARLERLAASVDLYKAMGGGWRGHQITQK